MDKLLEHQYCAKTIKDNEENENSQDVPRLKKYLTVLSAKTVNNNSCKTIVTLIFGDSIVKRIEGQKAFAIGETTHLIRHQAEQIINRYMTNSDNSKTSMTMPN